mmetsp:Transcript_39390/g.98651  ORF Transcript_39390/g.98651 Transcript_39390/m.98651 type:complete len:89 (+) Transcript_39390:1246-1512(+)
MGAHKTDMVHAWGQKWGFNFELLPPNMTDKLQVMDLVVNRPLKALLRRYKSLLILEEFKPYLLESVVLIALRSRSRLSPHLCLALLMA